MLAQVLPGFKDAYTASQHSQWWTTLYTDQEMHQTLARPPYALGFSDLGAIMTQRLPIKALQVNGVLPTAAHVRSGHYPLMRTLAFVLRPENLSPQAKAFFDFTQSAAGEGILRANGYLPRE